MKNIFLIISLVTLLGTTSCSNDWLDINTDPNNPSSASPELLLPNGVLASGVVSGGYYNLLGGMYSQYWAQSNASNQYRNIDSYNLTNTDFETEWETLYGVALSDLRNVRETSEQSGSWNLYLQATVMEVYTWQMLVDLYDKIPYFNALKGLNGVYVAGYDDGDKIYDDLIAQLDKALSKDQEAASAILSDVKKKQDIIFGGDVSKWIQFANTLKLKIYLRQMYARPSVSQTGITNLITSGVEFLSADAKIDGFLNEQDKDNPLFASNIRNLNTPYNLRTSATLFKYLQNNVDSRFSHLCGPSTDGKPNPLPMPQGGYELLAADLDPARVSVFTLSPVTPVYFFTLAEVNFMQAEVAALYGIGGNSKDFYDAGVLAAFAMYGENGASYIATGGSYEFPSIAKPNMTLVETQQEAIMMQKWISMAGIQGLEMFLETNRTGYPKVSTKSGNDPLFNGGELTYSLGGTTAGLFPKRLLIPASERAGNPSLPSSLLNAKITDKVWWDKK